MAGETVVLLHSSGSTPRQWKDLAGRLRMRAVAPPLVGHDDTPPWGKGIAPSLEREVQHLCARLPHDGAGVHLVGHSYGGAVAIKAALSGRLDVRSVTVYEPSLFAFLDDDRASPLIKGRVVTSLFRAGAITEAARTYVDYWTSPGEFGRMAPEKRARIVERMGPVVDCFAALFTDGARPRDLNGLDVPILVMGGRHSPRPSQDICEIVAGSVPNGRLHWFSALDHMGPVTDPAAVNAVIEEFLQVMVTARAPKCRVVHTSPHGFSAEAA